ncbi:hypothetical protein [Lacticaseibacillus paracasei]|uniref:hypothetical protein n=1 Tax=Lacticaseibacillus paracasei TaxID=1597 RepID=UPI001890D4BE|nr:hypothetical protein [Lacticaseibacillus paracasei]QPB55682.1 hypothetical protein GFB64_00305 [Lacticaseibacillus paracasei]WPQ30760.1 hypothetical protein SH597_00285 [Lacticaseibacillus paracasei]
MESKNQIIAAMEKLSIALNAGHQNSETARLVTQTLEILRKTDGPAFPSKLQYFFNYAPTVKLSDNFSFSETEKALWNDVFSFKQLGNYGWVASE